MAHHEFHVNLTITEWICPVRNFASDKDSLTQYKGKRIFTDDILTDRLFSQELSWCPWLKLRGGSVRILIIINVFSHLQHLHNVVLGYTAENPRFICIPREVWNFGCVTTMNEQELILPFL